MNYKVVSRTAPEQLFATWEEACNYAYSIPDSVLRYDGGVMIKKKEGDDWVVKRVVEPLEEEVYDDDWL